MPRTRSSKKGSPQVIPGQCVTLPADVYEDIMKKVKLYNAKEKYISELEEIIRSKDRLIAEHDGEWQLLHNTLDRLAEDIRTTRESMGLEASSVVMVLDSPRSQETQDREENDSVIVIADD